MKQIFNRELIMALPARKIRQWVDSSIEAPESLAWLVFLILAANALAYIVMFGDPLIRSDAWYFLDVFIRKAVNGTLHLGDFFVRRGGMDHAQPLRKLILLLDLNYFDLDFRYEAIAGWIGAVATILILRRLVFWHEVPERRLAGMRVWIWAALCMVLFSMNSPTVWGWPLMTGNFTSYALLFATLLGLWRWLAHGRPTWFVICAIAFDIAADDSAMLVNIACLLTLGIVAWQNPLLRRRVLTGAGMLIASFIAVRICYALLFTPPAGLQMSFGAHLSHLWSSFIEGGWWQWLIVPLASSVADLSPLRGLVGDSAGAVQIAIGLLLLLAHVWFWWRVLWKRPKITAPGFAAIVVMLTFYALVAGIIFGRIAVFGNNYLNSPRYVLSYSFNLVALLLMAASCNWDALRTLKFMRPVFVVLVALFAFWQIPLSARTWNRGPYVKVNQQKTAWQIGQLARDPMHKPEHCVRSLVICHYKASKRAELLDILRSHRLNVFSRKFQRTNRLSPDHPPQ